MKTTRRGINVTISLPFLTSLCHWIPPGGLHYFQVTPQQLSPCPRMHGSIAPSLTSIESKGSGVSFISVWMHNAMASHIPHSSESLVWWRKSVPIAVVFCHTWGGRFYHNKLCCRLSAGLGKQLKSIKGWKKAPLGKIAELSEEFKCRIKNGKQEGRGIQDGVTDESRAPSEKRRKEGTSGKGFQDAPVFSMGVCGASIYQTQCGTMISMNITDTLSILSV